MKVNVKRIDGEFDSEIDLPAVFGEVYRPDLIKKSVISIQSRRRQPHGTNPYAGINNSGLGWGSGRGASHVPRLKNGSRAVKVPQARGGREAHPPKVQKIIVRRINKKENAKALSSAIAASSCDELVRLRGHRFSCELPIVLEDRFSELLRTKDVVTTLNAIGVYLDVERSRTSRKVRAGRGKMRGRRYKQRTSVLIVTADSPLKAARNLAGVDAVTVNELNTELLAPGTQAGRLTIWTKGALEKMGGKI